jgi:hypothetical protein
MKKFMVPMALALVLSAAGAAFAASSDDPNAYLYAQPSPFAQPADTTGSQNLAAMPDPRLDSESQQASMANQQAGTDMPHHRQWTSSDAQTDDGIFGPYGPE